MIESNLKNANILIVDDQEANIDVLVSLLEMEEYTNIKTTTDPRTVLGMLSSFKPDLILLDLMMPYLTGFEVMEMMKSVLPAESYLPILVLTADISDEAKQQALSGGAKDFLVKPFDLIEVNLRIRNLLETRYLHQQHENRNRILDQKVKERTAELERINIELLEARDKAEASDRLKSAFINNISHEIRTPLNGILGFSTLIADLDIGDDIKRNYIPLLQSSSDRLLNTLTDYMDISLIASGNMEIKNSEFRVNEILNEITAKYQPICEAKGLNLSLLVPSGRDNFSIIADPVNFRKIISHLIDNAIKFTREGHITLGYTVNGNDLKLVVRDTGIGIEKASHEIIFENFIQEDMSATRGHEGSGLGLSITKGLVTLMGGSVRLESEKGKGTEFSVILPVTPGSAKSEKQETTGEQPAGNELPVVLIAEDEFANRVYFEILLRKYTSNIHLATNGKEAVEMCREHPEISLVLMDIKMPVKDGFEATTEIKSFRKDLPVIAVTAYAMREDEQKALDAGCDDYIAKPISKELLLDKLKQYGLPV